MNLPSVCMHQCQGDHVCSNCRISYVLVSVCHVIERHCRQSLPCIKTNVPSNGFTAANKHLLCFSTFNSKGLASGIVSSALQCGTELCSTSGLDLISPVVITFEHSQSVQVQIHLCCFSAQLKLNQPHVVVATSIKLSHDMASMFTHILHTYM